ncbi:hypothetical protein JCM10207_009038 [Rhodosporidiobolus poonsookiae]
MPEQESSFNLAFDPLYGSPTQGGGQEANGGETQAPPAPDSPFSAAFSSFGRSRTAQPSIAISSSSPRSDNLLVDFDTTSPPPPPASSKSTRTQSSPKRRSACPPSAPSSVRKSSPLKFSFFEDSFDETSPFPSASAPDSFAQPVIQISPAHKTEEDVENDPAPKRSSGRKWGVMSRVKEEKARRRSRSLSPVKEWTEGNSSVFFSPHHFAAGDLSLIADESFAGAGANVTLDASGLSRIGEEAEEGAGEDMGDLLRGLHQSTLGPSAPAPGPLPQTELPSSKSTPELSNIILPSSLSTTRPPLSRSLSQSVCLAAAALPPVPPLNADVEPSFLVEGDDFDALGGAGEPSFLFPPGIAGETSLIAATSAPLFLGSAHGEASFLANESAENDQPTAGDVSLLNASTSSFKEYRDSPVKPRVVSIQAERWVEQHGPARGQGRMGRISDVSETSEDGTSGSSFDLTGWKTGEISTAIFSQSPPTAALQPELTRTLSIGLQSPLVPTRSASLASFAAVADEPVDLLACSTRTVVPGDDSFLITPRPSSPISSAIQADFMAAPVPEGDLLGIGDVAPSPPRPPVVDAAPAPSAAPTPAKSTATTDLLRRRLEKLRAEKLAGTSTAVPAPAPLARTATTPRQPRVSTAPLADGQKTPVESHPFAASGLSTVVKPVKPSRSSPNLAALAKPEAAAKAAPPVRSARPRQSTLPASSSRPSTPPPAARASSAATLPDGSRTPGERKESTRARLERLRQKRQQREQAKLASPEKKSRPPVATLSLGASAPARRASVAPGLARSGPRASVAPAGLPASKSLGDLKAVRPAGAAAAATRLAARPSSALARPAARTSLAPGSSTTTAPARPASSHPAARPSLARPALAASSSSTLATSTASTLSGSTTSTKRAAPPKLQFSGMPLPRARVPLKGTQPAGPAPASAGAGAAKPAAPGAKAAVPTLKSRTSRIGLGRPPAASSLGGGK